MFVKDVKTSTEGVLDVEETGPSCNYECRQLYQRYVLRNVAAKQDVHCSEAVHLRKATMGRESMQDRWPCGKGGLQMARDSSMQPRPHTMGMQAVPMNGSVMRRRALAPQGALAPTGMSLAGLTLLTSSARTSRWRC